MRTERSAAAALNATAALNVGESMVKVGLCSCRTAALATRRGCIVGVEEAVIGSVTPACRPCGSGVASDDPSPPPSSPLLTTR